MFSFRTLVSEPTLIVRGYLRLDYDGGSGAEQTVAYPFGEFRFSGCRKIVSTAHRSQMRRKDFALAPKNTIFHFNGFDQAGGGLTMLDGAFVVRSTITPPSVLDAVNEPKPLPQDASATIAQRIDIPVLGTAASSYRSCRRIRFPVSRRSAVLLHGPATGVRGQFDRLIALNHQSLRLGGRRFVGARRRQTTRRSRRRQQHTDRCGQWPHCAPARPGRDAGGAPAEPEST